MFPRSKTSAGRYEQLASGRQPFLSRARQCAHLTIPSLIPPKDSRNTAALENQAQSVGAHGVKTLAAKLVFTLFPPNTPFFKLALDLDSASGDAPNPGIRGEIEKALGTIERTVLLEMETGLFRAGVFTAVRHLLVTGNVLLFLPPDGGMRVFPLARYVVQRDPMGAPLEIVVRETLSPETMPAEWLKENGGVKPQGSEKTLDLYTHIKRTADRWDIWQEVKGKELPGTRGHYGLEVCPWIPLRFTAVEGEDYGRSYVEEYLSDLDTLDTLTASLRDVSAIMARCLFLVDPTGVTEPDDIAGARNGDVKSGRASDVSCVKGDKLDDFRVTFEMLKAIEQRMALAFLQNTAVQRGGDRVTATEIRSVAGELEDALGGVYSLLAQDLQLPLVRCLIHRLEQQRRIPRLPPGLVRPVVITGLEALGRGHDLQKLDTFIAGIGQIFGPQAIAEHVDVSEYLNRRGTAIGIDTEGLIRTPEEVAAAQEAAQMQAMVQRVGPQAVQQVGGLAKEAMSYDRE